MSVIMVILYLVYTNCYHDTINCLESIKELMKSFQILKILKLHE